MPCWSRNPRDKPTRSCRTSSRPACIKSVPTCKLSAVTTTLSRTNVSFFISNPVGSRKYRKTNRPGLRVVLTAQNKQTKKIGTIIGKWRISFSRKNSSVRIRFFFNVLHGSSRRVHDIIYVCFCACVVYSFFKILCPVLRVEKSHRLEIGTLQCTITTYDFRSIDTCDDRQKNLVVTQKKKKNSNRSSVSWQFKFYYKFISKRNNNWIA